MGYREPDRERMDEIASRQRAEEARDAMAVRAMKNPFLGLRLRIRQTPSREALISALVALAGPAVPALVGVLIGGVWPLRLLATMSALGVGIGAGLLAMVLGAAAIVRSGAGYTSSFGAIAAILAGIVAMPLAFVWAIAAAVGF
jgi:hypothetical protein